MASVIEHVTFGQSPDDIPIRIEVNLPVTSITHDIAPAAHNAPDVQAVTSIATYNNGNA